MTKTYIIDDKPSLDELKHYGVKGMHWGQRMAERKRLRSLDKESKKKDQVARNAEIDAARSRYNESARKNYLDAKAQYKIDKRTIGKREAAKKLNEVKQKNMDDYDLASQIKHGKETTAAVLLLVGAISVRAIFAALATR